MNAKQNKTNKQRKTNNNNQIIPTYHLTLHIAATTSFPVFCPGHAHYLPVLYVQFNMVGKVGLQVL